MNPFIFWLEVAAIVVLLYFVLLLVDTFYQAGTGKSKLWFKRHIYKNDDDPWGHTVDTWLKNHSHKIKKEE